MDDFVYAISREKLHVQNIHSLGEDVATLTFSSSL